MRRAVIGSVLGAALGVFVDASAGELSEQAGRSRAAMLANISPRGAAPGAVTASPSTRPDYRYHWVRDAALVMRTVLGLRDRETDTQERARLEGILGDFARLSRRNQETPTLSGFGEPKFHLDGRAFDGPWGRPQNDGPALRAIALAAWAERLLAEGREREVRELLYSPELPARTVVKADLEFVSHQWKELSFDLWEEVRGSHFFTRLVQRRALLDGARLAERLKDGGAAAWYRLQARALEAELTRHWSADRGFILETLDRDDGRNDKTSGLDAGVVLGALVGDSGDGFLGVADARVLATAAVLEDAFGALYAVNRRQLDWEGLSLAPAIGRYPEDRYDGYETDREGNAWFLVTHAFAELHFRLATLLAKAGWVKVDRVSRPFYERALGARLGAVDLRRGDPRFDGLIAGLRGRGDAFLRRSRFHAGAAGELSEQLNRHHGRQQGAEQLTWSHASLLEAVWARAGGTPR